MTVKSKVKAGLAAVEKAFQDSEKEMAKEVKEAEAAVIATTHALLDHFRERMQRTHIWTEQDEERYNAVRQVRK